MTQRLRLASGLVLFAYVATHLLNHALGLISVQAAEAGRWWFTAFWRHPLGTIALYVGLLTHLSLVLWALYLRRHLRLPRWELIRLALGLLIPFFLLQHALGTRLAQHLTGIDDSYTRQMLFYWVLNPRLGAQQILLLVIAWVHGCMGIHYWLRVKPWHRISIPVLRILGLLIPLAAIGGFVDMGQELGRLVTDPEWARQALIPTPPEQARLVATAQNTAVACYLVVVGLVFVARGVRTAWQRRLGVVRLTYPDARQVQITPGTTVLEASRAAGIPHASLCGGRGRCSTCRTRLVGPLAALPKPPADEARVLRRIGAPPDVRLGCQLRPTVDLLVFPLMPPVGDLPRNPLRPSSAQGAEQEIAILFADLRGFTAFSERRLPYDVVFVLNQYFAAMGDAVEQSGGYLDKFVGDGVMALFGLHGDPGRGCLEALRAAIAMAEALDTLNQTLAVDLAEPLRIGIGVHVGSAIVGEMGYRQARSLTAVGDAVNIASRLEALTKEYGCQLVFSVEVARRAGIDLDDVTAFDVDIRGRTAPLLVRVVTRAADLSAVLSVRPS